MGGVLFGLYRTHQKQRTSERAKREQYWREQVLLVAFPPCAHLISAFRMRSTKI
jgi:hypothetical protein